MDKLVPQAQNFTMARHVKYALVFAATACCAVLIVYCSKALNSPAPFGSEELSRQANDELVKLGEKYRIAIIADDPGFPVKTFHGAIEGRQPSSKDLGMYAPILISEWNLYPVTLIERTRLKRIILCADLAFAGQSRTALPDFEHDDLYLDVSSADYAELYRRKVIHHEFFHIIDYCNGTLYVDERWSRLLPKGVSFGEGGRYARDAEGSLTRDDIPGFLNTYSMSGVEEDKAEVFANMVANGRVFEALASRDKLLKQKAQMMKEVLQAFCPSMDHS